MDRRFQIKIPPPPMDFLLALIGTVLIGYFALIIERWH